MYEGDVVTGIPRLHCGSLQLCEACTPVFCAPCVFLGGLREYKHVGIGVYLSRKGQGDVLLSPSGAERLVYVGVGGLHLFRQPRPAGLCPSIVVLPVLPATSVAITIPHHLLGTFTGAAASTATFL